MKKIITILTTSILPILGNAQTATIYRSGVPLTPTYSTIAAALPNIINGDELRLSAHTFNENNLSINKYIVLKGSISGADTTIINGGGIGYVLNFNYVSSPIASDSSIIMDIIISGGNNSSATSATYGGGGIICNTHLILTGNVIIRNNKSTKGGAGISSNGQLEIIGGESPGQPTVKIYENICTSCSGGGIIGLQSNIKITGNAIIQNNSAQHGGGLWFDRPYTKYIIIDSKGGSIKINNNKADLNGAGIYLNAVSAAPPIGQGVIIKGNVEINNNTAGTHGGGIWNNDSLRIEGAAVQFKNNTAGNMGGGIYNKSHSPSTTSHGTLLIDGSEFNGNKAAVGAGLYNDYYTKVSIQNSQFIYNQASGTNASNAIENNNKLSINNCRIYNPKTSGARQLEIRNNFVLNSSQCWWGESDTTGLIVNNPTFGATLSLSNWVKANWSINNGSPVGTATSYPIAATFTLNTGAALPASSFAMLQGKFTAASGSFSPAIANNTAANKITSTYTRPSSGTATLWAVVDADSFKSNSDGLSVQELSKGSGHFKIYPNPSTGLLFVAGIEQNTRIKIMGIQGNLIEQKDLNTADATINLGSYANGMYILMIENKEGQMEQFNIVKQ